MSVLRDFAGRLGALVLGLLLVLLATDAAAQRAFSQRFTTNANGDVLMIGNANMTCPTAAANCPAARAGGNFSDNDFAMVDIDIDADGTTFNSSSAQLNMPAGSTVLFAGLYWGANSGAAARNQVLMQRPGGFGYQPVTASQVDTTGSTQYGAFSNVTAAVQAGGNGTYTVANIQRTTGTNQWAGWSLIVVYKNNAATLKNLTVFDGFQIDPVTTTVSGFLTPLSGPITTRLGFVGYDGDRADTSAGEAFTINGVAIVDGQNPALNFYNSTISNLGSPNTARNPSYDNTLGMDIDLVNAPAGAVGNGATSATIQLGNANEDIWIQVVVFATDIYVPIITPNVVKTVTDVNGGSLNRGDLLRYNITLSNTGFDTATNVVVTDNIPANTTYEVNSLVIVSGANAGAKSDTAANDQAEFLTSPNRVVFRLGTGANGTTGGTIANGQATAIQFDVRVDMTTPAGAVIDNSATISYSGQTLGATFGTTSAAATATVNGPPTITKSFVPNTIPNAGTSVLTLVVSNPAANPSALTGVTFTDTYPANLVNTGAPSPQITCTAGSTAGTLTAAPNVGSVSLTPGATIAPGGSCTVTVNVTSLTDGAYTNTTGAVNSTNGGVGNTASDTLSVGKPRITKAFSPTTILAGGTSTVTLTLMNPTAVNLTNVAFSDTLTSLQVAAVPAVTNTCGGTFTAPAAATSVNLAGGTLNAGATCTVSFAITSSIAGVLSNTASGATSTQTAPAGNPSNTVQLTVIGAPVITKAFSPTSTNVNVPVQLTITVTNPNPTFTLTGVAFTDTYPTPGGSAQMTNDNPSNRTLNCTAGSTATATGGANNGTTVGISGGSLAPNGSCTITVNVESTAITGSPVSYVNTTGTVTSTNGGTGAAASATLTVATLTPPTAAKAFAPANIAAGGTSVMTITLTNANATAVTGVAFTDVYPTGLVNAATPATGTTCPSGVVTATAGGGQIAFTGSINANSSCTVTVTVTSPAAGTRFNSIGTVNSANAGSSTGGSATLNARTPPSMTKVFNPATVALNGDSTMTIVLTNVNDVALTGVGFTDTFPAGMSARGTAAPTNTCGGTWLDTGGAAISNGDAGVRLTGGTIPANGSCTLTVTVRGITNGTWTNTTGTVTATGPVALTGNTASDILAVGALGITKSFGTSPIVTGANSLLTFTIANPTGAIRTGLAFTDAYPVGLVNSTPLTVGGTCTGVTHTATAGGSSFNVTAGTVALAGCTITVQVTSSTGGTYLNTTSGATYTGNAVPGSPSNTASLDVYTPPLINKAFAPTTIAPSTPSTLTFTITNNNGATMTGVAFTDTFPVGMVVAATPNATNTCGGTFADSAGGAIGSGDVGVRITAGSITANTTCTITVDVTSAASGTYNNSTGAVTSTNMGNGVADTATLIVTSPPTAAKSFAPAAIGLNGTSTLTITLTNPNAGTAITGAAFTDTYPAGMVNDATPNASSSCGGTVTAAAAGSTLALVGGTIPAGGNCAISVVVTGTTSGAKVNSTGAITTTNTANGTAASGTLTVLNLLTVAKTFTPTTVGANQASVLTITLTNTNAVAVTGAAFSDAYPSGMVNTAAAGGATTCTGSPTLTAANNGTSVSLSGATVPASGSCTVTVNVTSATAGSYVNSTGSVTTANAGTAAAAGATLTVIKPTLDKSFGTATLDDGGLSTLVFTLTNGTGNPAQGGIAFTETLPASLRFIGTPLPIAYSAGCSGPATVAVTGGNQIALTGIAMTLTTASCTVTVANGTTNGVSNVAGQLNASCAATPAAFTNTTANITAATNVLTAGVTPACVVVRARPALTKAFGAASVGVGQTQTLTFSVANTGTGAVNRTGVSFTDTLLAGITIANPPAVTSANCGAPAFTAANNTQPFTASNISVNAGQTCTITLTIRGVTAGTVANNAAQITAISGIDNNVGTTSIEVVQASLAKAFGAATIDAGANTTLVFTLTNGTGNPAQAGIGFTETLPASLRFIGTPLPIAYSAGCSGPATVAVTGGNQVAMAGVAMAATTASCTVTVGNGTTNGVSNVAGQFNGSCAGNPAAFTNLTGNVTAGANVTTTTVTPACLLVASLPTLTKAFGAATVGLGQTQTLAFSIANTGTGALARTGISFNDTLQAGLVVANPPAVTFAACGTPTFTAADNTQPFTASTISVAAGATCVITLTVRGTTLGAKNNTTADVTAITGANNGVTLQTITVVQPALTKAFAPAAVDTGTDSVLTFTLANGAGNPAQGGINFTDTLPANVVISPTPGIASTCPSGAGVVTAVAATGIVTVTGATMSAAQASCTISVNVRSSIAGTYANTNAGNITATQRVDTTGVNATLTVQAIPAITKAFGAANVGLGQTTTLVFTIPNTGTNAVARSAVAFTDTLPAGLVIANPTAPSSTNCGAPTFTAADNTQPFTASAISIAAGATCTVTLTVRGTTLGAKVNGAGQMSALAGITNGVTNQTVTVVQPALTKAFVPAAVDTGTDSVLTFTLTNGTGNPAQGGINFTDTLPANVVISPTPGIATTCPSGAGVVTATAGTGVVTVTGATMSAAQVSCTISVNVRSAIAGTYANTNAGNITATQRVDTTGVNATLTVQAGATLTKAFGAANVGLGQATTLAFSIANTGTNAVARSGISFTDTLPAGLVIANPPVVTSTACGAPTFTAVDNTQPFTASTVSVAAGATCVITLTVRGTTLGAKVNGAAQMSAVTGVANGVTNQTVTVVQPALTKAFAPTAVDTNTDSVLTFTLANGTGNPAQGGINFTDTLPTNVVVSPTPGIATTCPSGAGVVTATAGTGVVTVTGATMSAAQASCTISVNVRSSIAGTYANTNAGNITATQQVDTTGVNATLTVQAGATLTKAFGAANVGLGQTTTLAFSIANTGTNAVARSGISFTDTLPAGLVIANPPVVTSTACGAPAFTAVDNTQPFTASTVSVAAGATCVITLTVRGATLGAKVNGAAEITAIAGATNGVTNQTVTVVQAALTKAFAPTAVDIGTDSVLTFTLANGTGNPAQGGINFTDTLPANVVVSPTPGIATTCPSGTGVVTATAGTGVVTVTGATMSAAQASCTISVNVRSAIAGTYANTNAGNITVTQRIDTTGVNATLTVQAGATLTKAFGAANVGLGQTTTLAFSIANTGTNAVARSGISFTDTLPAGLVIANPPVVTSTACGAPTFTAVDNTQPFTASTVSVAAGATCVITLTVRGTTLGAKVNGAAQITAIAGATNGVTNQTVTVVQPALTKAFAPTAVDIGTDSVLTFTLANGTGNPAQAGINFTDTLPTNLVVSPTPGIASTCPSGAGVVTATAGSGTITVTGASMNNAQASCTISVNVRSAVAGTYANTNAANITATQRVDTTGVNATLTVQSGATLTKAFGAANVGLGQATTLAFSIDNTGTNAVARSGISFTDTLPAGLVIANPPVVTSTACGAPAFTAVDNTQPFTASTVSVAAGATCVITLTVRGTTLGAKVNGAAQITAIAGVTNGVTNQTVTVVQPALTKVFAPAAVDLNTDSVLTFTLANGTGNPAESGINFTDTLPTNVVVSPTPGVATTCPSGTGVVTATAGSGVITVTGATMGAALASCTISVNVRSATAGVYTNTNAGNITATQRVDTTGVNATLTVQSGATLTKAFGAANVGLGQATTLAFTIANTGASAVARSGISFTDTLPAGLVIANPPVVTSTACGAPAFTAVDNTQPFTASTVSVAAGATCVITLTVRGTTLGAKVNGAAQMSAVTGVLNGITNQTVTVVQPALTKAFAPSSVDLNTDSVLTFTLANGTGNPAEAGINFTDTLPTNVVISPTPGVATTCPSGTGVVTAPAASGIVTVTGATMSAAQASCTISVNVRSAIAGTYANTNAGNITATQRVDTTGVNATLTVQSGATLTKAFGAANVGLGQATTLAFSIDNTGTNAVARPGISFTDTLPAGLVIANPPVVTSTACGAPTFTAVDNTQPFTASSVSVAAGATCSIVLTVRGTTLGAKINGAAQMSAVTGVTNGVTNQTVTVVQPALTKAFAPTAVDLNTDSVLTFTLANGTGNPAQAGINFTDTLPTNVVVSPTPGIATTCPSGTGVVTATAGSGVITVTGATMSAAQVSCTISVNVRSATAGVYTNTNAGNITAAQRVDTTGVNATLTVQAGATLTKAFGSANVGLGQVTTLAFTIANTGASAVARSGISFTDTLPAGLVIANPPVVTSTACGAPTFTAVDNTQPFTASNVSVAAGATCVVTLTVRGTTLGAKVNGTAQMSAVTGVLNGITNQTVTVVQPALTKAFAPSSVDLNTDSVLTFTLANGTGNPAQGGINFTDTLPTNVVVSPTPGVASTCPSGTGVVTATAGSGVITVTGATMSAAQVSCTISVNVRSAIAGTYANTNAGNITAAQRVDTTGVNATLTVQAGATLTKTFGAANIGLGQTTTLAFSIDNTGTNAVARSGISFTDTLPAGLVIANPPVVTSTACGAPTFTAVDNTQPFTAGTVSVAAGATCVITLTVRGATLGAKVNGAAQLSAVSGVTNGVTNQTVTVVQPALTKAFAPSSVDLNTDSVLTFTLANGTGNPTESGINFTDTLPANVVVSPTPGIASTCPSGTGVVTATAGSGVITVTGATMSAAQVSCTISVNVRSAIAGVYANTNAGNITATQRVDTTGVNATLTVQSGATLTKAFGAANVGLGQTTTLAFSIDNTGANAVARSGIGFTDTLPAGLVIANPPVVTSAACGAPTFTAVDNTQPFTAAGVSVAAGATCVITLTVRGSTLGAKVNGAAQMSAVTGVTNGVTNQTVTVVQPALAKAFAPSSVDINTDSVLTFTLTNGTGNPAQAGINFTDTLPTNVVVSPTPGVASTCPSGTGVVTATAGSGAIAVTGASMNNAQATCTISVNVRSAIAGVYANTNAGNITAAQRVDTTGVNATLTVQAAATLTKAFGAANIGLGQTTTLAFSIDNTGTNAVARSGISFTDTLPAGLVIANPPVVTSTACGAPTFTAVDNTQPFTAGTVSVAAGATCVITLTVRGTTVGAKVNGAAQMSAVTGVTNGVTNQTVTVVQASLAKVFTPSTIDVGGTSTLVFTFTNGAGNPAQSGMGFTDTLPAGVTVSGTPNVLSNCPAGGALAAPTFTLTPPSTISGVSMNAGVASCEFRVDVTSATPGTYTNATANFSGVTRLDVSGVNAQLTVQALPTLTKAFGATDIGVGQQTALTFTIANPAGAPARSGLAFTDTFPAGLVIANPPVPTTTCTGTPTYTAVNNTGAFTVSGIGVNAGAASCTVTVTVTSATAGPYVNGAAQVTSITGMNNGVTNQTLNVRQATLTKAFAPTSISIGGTPSTLIFTLANGTNNPAQSGINLTDTLPSGLVVATPNGIATNCPSGAGAVAATAGGSTISVTGASLNNAQASCTISVNVSPSAAPSTAACPGNAANTNGAAQISGIARATNGVTDQCLSVTAATPTLAKSFSPATVAIGTNTTLTFTISQPVSNPTATFSFVDTLSSGLVVGSGAVGGTCAGGTVTATAGTNTITVTNRQVSGASCTITVPVTPAPTPTIGTCPQPNNTNAAGNISGLANLSTAGLASSCVDVTAARPTIAKSFTPATIASGATSTLLVTITNPNAAAITVTSVTDTFPTTPGTGVARAATPNASTTCTGGTVGSTAGSVTLTGGTVPANGSCTFQIDVTAATSGSYANTIAGGALTTNAGTNLAAANATLTVTAVANVAITKAGPASVATGAPIAYTLVISNAGPDSANLASFNDVVPAAITGVTAICGSPTGGAVCGTVNVAGNTVSGTVTTLPAGGAVQITINGTAPGTGTLSNTATVTAPAGTADPVPANNTSATIVTTVQAPNLTLTKSHAGNFTVGVNGTYTLSVSSSAGTLATTGTITVVDTLPAGLTFVSATGAGWACVSAPPLVTCTASTSIPAGGTGNPITLTVAVASTAIPAVTNTATVSGGGEPAALANDNGASDNTIVVAAAINTFVPDGAQTGVPGSPVFYAHTFNAGLAGSVGFSVSNVPVPAVPGWSQQIFRDTNCNATLDGAEGVTPLTGTIAVNPGDQVCIIVKENIPAAAPANARDVVTVTATFNGATTYTRTDTTTVGPVAGAGLTLVKTVRNVTQGGAVTTSNTAKPGDILDYSITYLNTSGGTVNTIVITDASPTFTLFQSAACGAPLPASLTACAVTTQPAVNGTGTVVWTFTGTLLASGTGTVSFQVRVQP